MNVDFNTIFIGGGPAGTGPIISAMQEGKWPQLLDSGIALIDRGYTLGVGKLNEYKIRSDSYATSFIECVEDTNAKQYLQSAYKSLAYRRLEKNRFSNVPLSLVSRFQYFVGEAIKKAFATHPRSKLFLGFSVSSIIRLENGFYRLVVVNELGASQLLLCKNVVIATGGRSRLKVSDFSNTNTTPQVVNAEQFLNIRCLKMTLTNLGTNKPRVAILGSSHSAFSVAWYLLRAGVVDDLNPVNIYARHKAAMYFDSREKAIAAGYTEFNDKDICPLTQRVFRLGGLRGDAKALATEMYFNRTAALRFHLLEVDEEFLKSRELDKYDVLVNALGYRANLLPIYDESGEALTLAGEGKASYVDDDCRLLAADGTVIQNAFLIGLGTGYCISGEYGGEESFKGQTDGLWLYQNDVGKKVVRQVLGSLPEVDTL